MMQRLGVVVGAAHIGPTLVVASVTTALAALSGLDPMRVAILGAMMLANQLSIGWSNDAIDAQRDLDARRRDKPVVRGEVSARTIMVLAVIAAVASVGLSLLLGLALATVHGIALASGWAYNLGLKRTVAATACYVISFGLIPLIVTLAREIPATAAWWAIAMGAFLGLAAHFANVLPDLDDDRRHGIRSLPHRIGTRPAGVVALASLSGAGLLGALGPPEISPLSAVGAIATTALLIAGVVVVVRAPASRALFRIIMVAAIAAVVTLAGAAGSFVAQV
ncbi:UbiA family prenyltransferase [Microcella sp.]|uniref:UbiA family prenyltransferase n=1 Tax=Microcella sp. TaxID=1913979 RepID=UPI00256AED5A|nr:UbiA family prenyltransferase [Microcella sp.]MBX9470629.1 UbiA family prenyltransferase [Microcella sp.]